MSTSSTDPGSAARPLLRAPEPRPGGRGGQRRPLVQLEFPLAEGRRVPAGRRAAERDPSLPVAGEGAPDWRLDDATRETGRVGVAAARAILARSARAA